MGKPSASRPRTRPRKTLSHANASLLVVALTMNACMTASLLRGERGADGSSLHPGATRAKVEASLSKPFGEFDLASGVHQLFGTPFQDWDSASGVHYAAYLYDGGRPSKPLEALVFAPFVVVNETLGLPFALYWDDPCVPYGSKGKRRCWESLRPRLTSCIVVGYDQTGKVLEVTEQTTGADQGDLMHACLGEAATSTAAPDRMRTPSVNQAVPSHGVPGVSR
jgi:hypothetical protein